MCVSSSKRLEELTAADREWARDFRSAIDQQDVTNNCWALIQIKTCVSSAFGTLSTEQAVNRQ